MNIVCITAGNRPEYLRQTISSLYENAADWARHTLTLVCDGSGDGCFFPPQKNETATAIFNLRSQGASASRNIGAGSIPKYRRQEHVMFVDDDVYACPGWDDRFEDLLRFRPTLDAPRLLERAILSGHAHPFNHDEPPGTRLGYRVPLVISSVHMVMPWSVFDEVGPWDEPGGPGGSEDYQLCMRAKDKGIGFAVTEPHSIIHCGLTSSSGKQLVGYDLMMNQNDALVKLYGLEGKVVYK